MRKMSAKNEKDFAELESYVNFFATHVGKVSPDEKTHPSQFLLSHVDKFTKSQLLQGLRQAANDTLEQCSDFNQKQIDVLDNACKESGVLTFTEIRRRFSKRYRVILRKQKISNETDYYLIADLINNLNSPVSDEERVLLVEIAAAYEQRQSQECLRSANLKKMS